MYSETSTYEGAPSFAVLACGSRPAKGGAAHLFSSPSVDGDGRRTSTTLPNGVAMNYSYDAASELTGITYTLGSSTLGTLSYAYDAAGRRIGVGGSYARTGLPQAASSASYNINNQLTNWKGATLTYDANGNLTSDGTNTYTWNARNQLVSISGSVNASFQYDPFGRRVSKTIGGTTQFLYDGANPVQEISGSSASANLLTGGIDEYFQRTDSAGARSFLTDALSSTLALADSTGTVQTSYTFEPFGNTTLTGSSTTNSLAYTGRELDPTGLYFYRARYYSPTFQRFISEDPLGLSGGDANLYGYVGNGPANFKDSSGMNRGCFTTACGGVPGTPPLNGRKPRRRGLPPGWYRCNVHGVRVAGGEFACDGRGHVYPAPLGNLSDPIFDAALAGTLGAGYGVVRGLLTGAAEAGVGEGTYIYRVFGGEESQGLSPYSTTVNPGDVGDYRLAAGLYPGNEGRFVIEGVLTDTEGVVVGTAAPGPGGVGGGLPQVFVPNPGSQITIIRVSGVNPPF